MYYHKNMVTLRF